MVDGLTEFRSCKEQPGAKGVRASASCVCAHAHVCACAFVPMFVCVCACTLNSRVAASNPPSMSGMWMAWVVLGCGEGAPVVGIRGR